MQVQEVHNFLGKCCNYVVRIASSRRHIVSAVVGAILFCSVDDDLIYNGLNVHLSVSRPRLKMQYEQPEPPRNAHMLISLGTSCTCILAAASAVAASNFITMRILPSVNNADADDEPLAVNGRNFYVLL